MDLKFDNVLDVTVIEPRFKHPTIFNRFDQLNEGESLTIHNDHDPKPLYYQLLGERGDIFTWEYLEQGPEQWKVKMTKRISGENEETLGEIAAKDLRKAQIFKKFGLDFCCGGKKTVKEACNEKGLDVRVVEQKLQNVNGVHSGRPLPYNDWNLDFLADYIVNTHHSYVRQNLPDIRAYAEKVMMVHGANHPELFQVHLAVKKVVEELTTHMEQEETALFPYIKKLVAAANNGGEKPGALPEPIKNYEADHEKVGQELSTLRSITDNYRLPEDACATYSLLFRMLDEFEDDLHLHIHLENNILFPKTLKLEKELA